MYIDVYEKIVRSVRGCGCEMPVSKGVDRFEIHAILKE